MFTVSAAMSGTFQAAKQVADRMGFPVHVVDFERADDEFRLAGSRGARGREAGASVYEMLATADKVRETGADCLPEHTGISASRAGTHRHRDQIFGHFIGHQTIGADQSQNGNCRAVRPGTHAEEINRGFRSSVSSSRFKPPVPSMWPSCTAMLWKRLSYCRAHPSNIFTQGIAGQHHRPGAGNPYRRRPWPYAVTLNSGSYSNYVIARPRRVRLHCVLSVWQSHKGMVATNIRTGDCHSPLRFVQGRSQ